MKLLFSLVLCTVAAFAPAQVMSPDSLEKKLSAHYEQYKPELFRYSGLTTYGETPVRIDKIQVEKELALFNEVKNSGLVNNPTQNVFALCHNLLIHSPGEGKELLKILNKPTTNEETLRLFYTEIIFTGAAGEQLALDNLQSGDLEWSKMWASYLSSRAIYETSIPVIEKMLAQTNDDGIRKDLIGALMYISNPKTIGKVKQVLETTQNDDVQTKCIFAFAELSGYDGIKYLETVKPVGEKSKEEKQSSIDWLKKETSPSNKFGVEVSNDIGFIERFGDIKSPAIIWMDKEGLLKEKIASHPEKLSKEKKDKLLDLLIESKGFGLEAVKAQLFLSLEPTDIDRLLTLRQMLFYSPNNFSNGRMKTVGLFVRYLRKTS